MLNKSDRGEEDDDIMLQKAYLIPMAFLYKADLGSRHCSPKALQKNNGMQLFIDRPKRRPSDDTIVSTSSYD